ncbi:CapE family protein [Bacillus thuringiensis]|nr:CapE family protein [Bacillus thuringiensis]
MIKKTLKWIIPIIIVGALLMTLGIFKRSETLTTDEQKKIDTYIHANN